MIPARLAGRLPVTSRLGGEAVSLLLRMLRALTPTALIERRNAAALARQLGIGRRDAAWIVRRSRQVGYPQARSEFERYAQNAAVTLEPPAARAVSRHRPAPDDRAP